MNLCFWASVFALFLAGSGSGQSPQVKLVFTENGEHLVVHDLLVDIVSTKTNKTALTLQTRGENIVVPPNLGTLGRFNVRLTFNRFTILLPGLNETFFENEWQIDVGESVPRKKTKKKGGRAVSACKNKARIFRVVFYPTNGEGLWWLLSDCVPAGRK